MKIITQPTLALINRFCDIGHSNAIFICNIIFCTGIVFSNNVTANEKQKVMGAGPSTAVVTLFFKHFSKTNTSKGYTFEVDQRSIKHAGGITSSNKYLFGRTGRPLNKNEKLLNKKEIFIARIPLTMVIGDQTGIKSITIEQLKKIMLGKITNWQQLGGANHKINLIGRENTEAAFGVLQNKYTFFTETAFEKILTRDHQVANFLKSKKGAYAISFGARSNFDDKYHLNVSGFNVGLNLGLVYDISNATHPIVKSAKEFSNSHTWIEIVKKNDFFPAQN